MVTFEQFYHVGVTSTSRQGQDPLFAWLTTQPGLTRGPVEFYQIPRRPMMVLCWRAGVIRRLPTTLNFLRRLSRRLVARSYGNSKDGKGVGKC